MLWNVALDVGIVPGALQLAFAPTSGADVGWRAGTESRLGVIYGHAPDHSAMLESVDAVVSGLSLNYT